MKKIFMATMVAATALFSACNGSSPKANLKTDVDSVSYEMGVVFSHENNEFQNMLAQRGSDSAYVEEYLKGFIEGMTSADDKKQMAHNLGMMDGIQTKMQMPMTEAQLFQNDSTKKISLKNFIAGFNDFINNKVVITVDGKPMDKDAAYKEIMKYMFSKQKTISADFMAKKAKEAGVKKLANGQGILYKEIAKGNADVHCTANDSVVVKYEGKLPDGSVFDSSDRAKDGQATLSLKNVIKGWQIAIPQMPMGATWEVYIPSELAYGETGSGPIPPYSALTFKITLVKVAK